MRSLPKKITPSRSTVTVSASSFAASGMATGFSTFTKSTPLPWWNGVALATMKIMSSTTITAAIGIKLTSVMIFLPSFLFAATILESLSKVLLAWRRGLLVVRRRWRSCGFALLRQQSQLVNAGRADIIHHVHNHAVLGMSISPHKDALVGFAVQLVSHLLG